jgi:hypothetical protein
MPIESTCQGCGKRLRVADEHAGKLAKCPQCQAVYTVPQSSVAAALGAGAVTSAAGPGGDRWHLKTQEGLTFGPVPRAELDRWHAEGRINAQSQILHEGDGQWQWAGQVYPHLAQLTMSPFAPGASAVAANPYAPPATTPYGNPYPPGTYLEPHRGGLILAFALIGVFACMIFSVVAIVLAAIDLQKMNRGTMDKNGRGLVIAGLVIASAHLALFAVVIGFAMLN